MSKFLLFSKKSCGPCGLVDRYFVAMNDERTELLEYIDLEDFVSTPTDCKPCTILWVPALLAVAESMIGEVVLPIAPIVTACVA